ncbi:hypothetical protein RhiJN_18088 [Ceratobasidium sp. AG-Ba]|nr:hypothetical protein RhiJN_18088 [Ceratobasidium sp. AG-Ba]
MGKASLEIDDNTPIHSRLPPIGDPTHSRAKFENACVQPTVLRIDTIPICPSRYGMFSSRLTAFHYMTGSYFAQDPNISEWHTILSAAPNLVELCLWHSRHGNTASVSYPTPISLLALRVLKLSGLFVRLSSLFAQSPLPSLKHLLLDSLDPENEMPSQITAIASVSPTLEEVALGSKTNQPRISSAARWVTSLQALPSLQKLTFFEMEWEEAAIILGQLDQFLKNPIHVRLERIYDLRSDALKDLEESVDHIKDTTVADCVEAGTAQNVQLEHSEGFFSPPRELDNVIYRKYCFRFLYNVASDLQVVSDYNESSFAYSSESTSTDTTWTQTKYSSYQESERSSSYASSLNAP